MSQTSPTIADKVEILQKFIRRLRKAEQGDFIERVQRKWGVNTVSHTIEASNHGRAWRFDYDGPSDSDITAFATDFGFFDKGRDDTSLFNIGKVYTLLSANGCIPKDILDAFRAQWATLLAHWAKPSPVCVTDFAKDFVGPDGQPLIGENSRPVKGLIRSLTSGELMTVFLYGCYLHENRSEARVVGRWMANDQLYPMMLIIFLHVLASTIGAIGEIAAVNARAIVHLATLNPTQRLPRSGVDPAPDVRMANMDADLLDLLSKTDPAIVVPMIDQGNGFYTLDL